MHPLLNVAVMAAHRGGDTLIRSLNQLDRIKVELKGRNDYVSEVDRAAERAVIATIQKHYPEHAILAEESGAQGESEYEWVIDPLDGTTNYLHGFPTFAVSVAVLHKGAMEHAAVHDPMRQETFTASRGRGAQLNGHKIRVSGTSSLERALVGTGFPFRNADQTFEPYFAMLRKAIAGTSGVRRPGAAALDLCYVAAGRLDAFWELGLSKWDMAGGALVIREAGGIVTALDGSDRFLETGHVLAATPKIHAALSRLFAPEIEALFASA
ncbi:MAG TPA: inositol monophosphatase family protein [Woeseiaceae bacterium]